ncbi:hypothetical protein METP3_02700 [Methanosarcinales archaeon]|nr:hypothetical protein METP3_02700 [Methanosarcinales archaeon]
MDINKETIKNSFHQIYQCIFKPITFSESIENLNKKDRIRLLLKLSLFSFIISILIAGLIKILLYNFEYPFNANLFLRAILLYIGLGLFLGITSLFEFEYGIAFGIAFGTSCAIVFGGLIGENLGVVDTISIGFAFGLPLGILTIDRFKPSIMKNIKFAIFFSIIISILFIFVINSSATKKYDSLEIIFLNIAFMFSYFRIFHILPHLIQYFRAIILSNEPFNIFRNSPIYWDEVIIMPLPFLSKFLVSLTSVNRSEGLKEIEFISARRPTQRQAASSALLEITIQDLGKFDSVKEIAQVSKNLSFLSAFDLSLEFNNAVRNIENISIEAKTYFDSSSKYNKIRTLQILLADIKKFQNILTATKGHTGYKFHSVAYKWYQIIEDENKKFIEIKKDIFEEIPNPYIFGTPVRTDDSTNRKIFVKRDDIIGEIESNLSNISQKPTLFLYGRRRVGKSSVLINLPGSLGKQYIPAYIDCQDGRTTESTASFCYSLSKSISDALKDRGSSSENSSLESFQKSPFTTLGNYFDVLEKTLHKEEKLILINLDEYEKLEESILRDTLPITILDQLRNIIQHRKYFVVLISGSRELSEMKLPWSDYLISAKTIKLGYLPEDATRTLITNPIDDFSLNYDGGVNGAAVNRIIEVTNCQPYLVQALCFELVNYMNIKQRKEAKLEDVNAAIGKVLDSANVYFYYIWKEECSENEKELLLWLVKNLPLTGNEKDINSLVRKEIIEKVNGGYKFKVELMKKWIEKNELL